MLFNSFIFILAFLPFTVIGYFALNKFNHTAAEVLLLFMSLLFYAYNRPAYLMIILSSIVINYLLSKAIRSFGEGKTQQAKSADTGKKALMWLGIAVNVGIIGYYKYLSFILWNCNTFLHTDFVIDKIVLPLGISFYTIQQISFLVDAYKGEKTDYNFVEYALYVSFFPQLVAGPIVYHSEFIPQIRDNSRHVVNFENLTRGLMWFTLGLSKKVFIADRLGRVVDWAYNDVLQLTSIEAWLVVFAYTFQIYFDFSGYSDMACGIATLFNIKLPQNFDSPYKSLSIRDFWKRWHMTLTRFLTKYIYIPLGGNRKGKLLLAVNTMIVFGVSGIWHGANYTFILWGILHGLLLLVNRFGANIGAKIPKAVKWPVNFVVVSILWALFRATGIRAWFAMLGRMFSFDSAEITGEFIQNFDSYYPYWMVFAIAIVISLFFENNYKREIKVTLWKTVLYAGLLALCLFTLNRTSIFLYFNF